MRKDLSRQEVVYPRELALILAAQGKEIWLVGMSFSSAERRVVEWEVQGPISA